MLLQCLHDVAPCRAYSVLFAPWGRHCISYQIPTLMSRLSGRSKLSLAAKLENLGWSYPDGAPMVLSRQSQRLSSLQYTQKPQSFGSTWTPITVIKAKLGLVAPSLECTALGEFQCSNLVTILRCATKIQTRHV